MLLYYRPVSGVTLSQVVKQPLVSTWSIKMKVPLGVMTGQDNYPIHIVGTKQRQELRQRNHPTISKLHNVFTIFSDLKPIHTNDINTALVSFTPRDDSSRHMKTLLTTDGEAHLWSRVVSSCAMDSAHTTVMNHSHSYTVRGSEAHARTS